MHKYAPLSFHPAEVHSTTQVVKSYLMLIRGEVIRCGDELACSVDDFYVLNVSAFTG